MLIYHLFTAVYAALLAVFMFRRRLRLNPIVLLFALAATAPVGVLVAALTGGPVSAGIWVAIVVLCVRDLARAERRLAGVRR